MRLLSIIREPEKIHFLSSSLTKCIIVYNTILNSGISLVNDENLIRDEFLKYLKDYKKESILAPVFKMLEASFELFVPLVMAAIIDTGIANHDKGYIFRMGGVLVALGLIGLACSVTAQFFSAKAAVGFATKLRHALFSHIQGLSYAELDTLGTNILITRMTSDVNQLQSGVNLTLRLLLRSPFIVLVP